MLYYIRDLIVHTYLSDSNRRSLSRRFVPFHVPTISLLHAPGTRFDTISGPSPKGEAMHYWRWFGEEAVAVATIY